MIVVVEGASTAGKSTWCSKFPQHLVLETGRLSGIPNRNADPDGAAQFWARQNAARWHEALTREQSSGVAICDTDPLKLHHVWTLWQTGQVQKQDWSRELNATRKLIQEKKIGFADLYLIKKVDPVEARRRRAADSSRTRRNFESNIRLQEPLMRWYEAFRAVLPQPVFFDLPDSAAVPVAPLFPHSRYALELFDEILSILNRDSAAV